MISPTGRAAVLPAEATPLEVRDIPVPDIEVGAALVEVEASSVCGTDAHLRHDAPPVIVPSMAGPGGP